MSMKIIYDNEDWNVELKNKNSELVNSKVFIGTISNHLRVFSKVNISKYDFHLN